MVRRIHIKFARIGRYTSLVGDNVVAKFHGRCPRRYIVSRVSQQFAISNFAAQRFEIGELPSFLIVFTQPAVSLDVVPPRLRTLLLYSSVDFSMGRSAQVSQG